MNLEQLNQYRDILTSIMYKEEKIAQLRDTSGPASPSLTGMPRTPGISDKVGNFAIEIADLSERLEYQRKEAEQLLPPIQEFISGIDDDQTRLIFRFRFVHAKSWGEVAEIMGGYATKDSVRQTVFRYLSKIEEV